MRSTRVRPSTAWLVGDIVQTRATRAIADVGGDPRVGEADAMLAGGYAGYLGVPMIGPEESAHGILAVYSTRPREWREEEAEALLALAATAAAARVNAELYQGVSHEQQRGEAILANVADGIVAVDREGKVVLWNPAAERVTGVSQAEALGQTPTEALGRPLDAAGGTPGGSRLLPIRRGGEEVWLSLSEAVMTDPAGAVAGRIYAFRDISSERSVEQMKSDFVSTVSHELRTPLTSIYGFAETLLRQDVLFGEEERATFLRYIASESERLTSIVDRLLSVAQLDTGAMAVQLAETDVGAVVSEAVRTAEGADGQNGHRFVVELADEPLSAEADGDKLRPGARAPARQRGALLAGRRHRHGRRAPPRGRRRGERRGRGRRHPARRAGADLPQVLPRRRGRDRRRRGRRGGPRPLPRRGSRHRDGRQDPRRLERGARIDLRARATRGGE